jgi:ABC-type transport system involved in cytochrome bd biosynthesis fused ATPase/permease subunit
MAVVFLATAAVQWPAAGILLVSSLFIPLNMRLAGLFAQEGADERLTATTRLAAVVLDSFRGMRTLHSIGAVARRRDELADAAADLDVTTMAIVRRAFLSGSVMDVVITFSIAANATYIGLSLLGYVRLDAAPTMTLFGGLFALLLCPMYFQPLRAMAAAYHAQERALSAVPTITALLTEVHALPQIGERCAPGPAGSIAVVLDNVTFRFPHSNDPVLHGVDLTVRPRPLDGDRRAIRRRQDDPAFADRRRAPTVHRDRAVGHRHRGLAAAPGRLCLDRPTNGASPRDHQRQHPHRTTRCEPCRCRACGCRGGAGRPHRTAARRTGHTTE